MAWFAAGRFLALALVVTSVVGSPRRFSGCGSQSVPPASRSHVDVVEIVMVEQMEVEDLKDLVSEVEEMRAVEDVLGHLLGEAGSGSSDCAVESIPPKRAADADDHEEMDEQLSRFFSGSGNGALRGRSASSFGAYATAPYSSGAFNVYKSLYPRRYGSVDTASGTVRGNKPTAEELEERREEEEWEEEEEEEEEAEEEEKEQEEEEKQREAAKTIQTGKPKDEQTMEMIDDTGDIIDHIDDAASDNLNDDIPIQEMQSILEEDVSVGAGAEGKKQVYVEPNDDGGVTISKVNDTERVYVLDADQSDEILPESVIGAVIDDDSNLKVHQDQIDVSVMNVTDMADVPVGDDVNTEGKEVHKDDITLSLVSVDPDSTDDDNKGSRGRRSYGDEMINVRKEDINLSVVSVDDGTEDPYGDESVSKDDSVKVNIVEVGDVSTYNVEEKSISKDADAVDKSLTTQIDTVEQKGEIKDGSDSHDKVIEHETVSSQEGEETSVKKTRSEEKSAVRPEDEDGYEFQEDVDKVLEPTTDAEDIEYDNESDLEEAFEKRKNEQEAYAAEVMNRMQPQGQPKTTAGSAGSPPAQARPEPIQTAQATPKSSEGLLQSSSDGVEARERRMDSLISSFF